MFGLEGVAAMWMMVIVGGGGGAEFCERRCEGDVFLEEEKAEIVLSGGRYFS